MDPARVVAGLVVLGLAAVTLAFPRVVLGYVEGESSVSAGVASPRPPRVVRVGAVVTAFVGLSLVVGL